jgi:hypothetical protein
MARLMAVVAKALMRRMFTSNSYDWIGSPSWPTTERYASRVEKPR